ncbi:hypothetical protein H5410_013958 [Solanum commersonii]|uniref:Uncharacterized protein n=1 Tax=Solanum commersonii TaxID=4109 RepID=A0A9J5ZPN4_SOLCO|nr:hypothetical protein H5410_013958 [Solanum commersonii]
MNYGYGNRSAKHCPAPTLGPDKIRIRAGSLTLGVKCSLIKRVSKVYQFGFMVANVAQETYGSLKNTTVCFALTGYINHVDILQLCIFYT